MIQWREPGILLRVNRQGEANAVIDLFTRDHGRASGLVRGGASRRMAPTLQPGTELDAAWGARIEGQLGTFRVEPIRARAAQVLGDRTALSALNSVCALLVFALPEGAPHPRLHAATLTLLDALNTPGWAPLYARWEALLLEEMGFGLDLSECAATGATDDLAYVSPKTGRAVSRAGGRGYEDVLLPLPPVLSGGKEGVSEALRTTGYFLERHLAPALGDRPLPEARDRLVRALGRA